MAVELVEVVVDLDVTEIEVATVAAQGIQGLQGDPGADGQDGAPGAPGSAPQAYIHNQMSPSDTWVIVHNLTFKPNVNVTDSGGTNVEGDITHDSANQMTITFSASFAGTAYLS